MMRESQIQIGAVRSTKSTESFTELSGTDVIFIRDSFIDRASLSVDNWEILLGCCLQGGAGQAIEGLGHVLLLLSTSFIVCLGRRSRCSRWFPPDANRKEAA